MFDYQYGLALFVGLVFSFPFGPMGMLAMSQWLHGHRRSARAIVYGICVGDLIIAMTVLLGLKVFATLDVPNPFKAVCLVIAGCVMWRETGSRRHAFTYRGPLRRFLLALGMTLVQPSNWGMYWGIYGLGTGYLVQTYRAILPDGFARLQSVTTLSPMQTACVLVLHVIGMAGAWVLYALLLQRYRTWKGLPRHPMQVHQPAAWSIWVGRGASVSVLSYALVLMVQSFEPLI